MLLNLFSFSFAAWAGRYVGNGGHIVECKREGESAKYELLDFAEATYYNPLFVPYKGEKFRNLDDAIQKVSTRISRLSPQRALIYRKKIQEILELHPFVEEDLVLTRDSLHYGIPVNCTLKQLAIRLNPSIDSYQNRWVIDKKIFDKLSIESQVGLLFHEAIYDELIESGDSDSVRTRFFNAALAGDSFSRFNFQQFWDLARQANLPYIEYSGFKLLVFDVTGRPFDYRFYKDGNLYMGHVKLNEQLTLKNGQILELVGNIYFNPMGNIKRVSSRRPILVKDLKLDFSEVDLDGHLNVIAGVLRGASCVRNCGMQTRIVLPGKSKVFFDHSGNVINYEIPK